MEFLLTYGWAILIVLVCIGALAYFGMLNPDKYKYVNSCKSLSMTLDKSIIIDDQTFIRCIKTETINVINNSDFSSEIILTYHTFLVGEKRMIPYDEVIK